MEIFYVFTPKINLTNWSLPCIDEPARKALLRIACRTRRLYSIACEADAAHVEARNFLFKTLIKLVGM